MKTKFTNGKWNYSKSITKKRTFQINAPGWDCMARCFYTPGDKKTGEANAKLIAAAPELLEALVKLIAQCKNELYGGDFDFVMEETGALKAIKKATE